MARWALMGSGRAMSQGCALGFRVRGLQPHCPRLRSLRIVAFFVCGFGVGSAAEPGSCGGQTFEHVGQRKLRNHSREVRQGGGETGRKGGLLGALPSSPSCSPTGRAGWGLHSAKELRGFQFAFAYTSTFSRDLRDQMSSSLSS